MTYTVVAGRKLRYLYTLVYILFTLRLGWTYAGVFY